MISRLSRVASSIAIIRQPFAARYVPAAQFVRIVGGKKKRSVVDKEKVDSELVPPPVASVDPWLKVVDKEAGGVYYWNTETNETTAIGAPKPNGPSAVAPPPPQQQGGISGLGSVMAEGFAFGTGSAIAHNVVGSLFGGGHSSNDQGPADSGGDFWDI